MIIGIDVDGVLSNFGIGFQERIKQVAGRDLFPPNFTINCWYWCTEQVGYTKEEDKAAWQSVMADPEFWFNLEPFPSTGAVLTALWSRVRKGDYVYFITDRPGVRTKQQTEEWLIQEGMPLPTVIVAADKAGVAKALKLGFYVDDKPENFLAVRDVCPTYLVDRGWNQQVDAGLMRIKEATLAEVIKHV